MYLLLLLVVSHSNTLTAESCTSHHAAQRTVFSSVNNSTIFIVISQLLQSLLIPATSLRHLQLREVTEICLQILCRLEYLMD